MDTFDCNFVVSLKQSSFDNCICADKNLSILCTYTVCLSMCECVYVSVYDAYKCGYSHAHPVRLHHLDLLHASESGVCVRLLHMCVCLLQILGNYSSQSKQTLNCRQSSNFRHKPLYTIASVSSKSPNLPPPTDKKNPYQLLLLHFFSTSTSIFVQISPSFCVICHCKQQLYNTVMQHWRCNVYNAAHNASNYAIKQYFMFILITCICWSVCVCLCVHGSVYICDPYTFCV